MGALGLGLRLGGRSRRRFDPARAPNTVAFWYPHRASITTNGAGGAGTSHYSQITDLSGNGRHLAQATPANQVARIAAHLNGRDAAEYVNGSGRFMLASGVAFSGSFALVIAAHMSVASYYAHHDAAGVVSYLYGSTGATMNLMRGGQSAKDRAAGWGTDGAMRVIEWQCEASHASHTLTINGVVQALSDVVVGAPNATPLSGTLGLMHTAAGATIATGHLGAAWLASPHPGAAVVAQVRAYMNGEFAVY